MAFPADVKLVRVTCGTGYDFSGDPIAITLEVTPVLGGSLKRLIHAATGTFMTRDALTFKSDPGSPATFTVPSPAQAETWKDGSGAFFTNWSYSVTVTTRTASGKIQSWIQSFQPVAGQETVDLDLVPDGQIGSPTSAPAPAVTSVNGQSGAVVIDGGEAVTPESVAANLTVEAVDAKLPERLSESALSTAIGKSVEPALALAIAGHVAVSEASATTIVDPYALRQLTPDGRARVTLISGQAEQPIIDTNADQAPDTTRFLEGTQSMRFTSAGAGTMTALVDPVYPSPAPDPFPFGNASLVRALVFVDDPELITSFAVDIRHSEDSGNVTWTRTTLGQEIRRGWNLFSWGAAEGNTTSWGQAYRVRIVAITTAVTSFNIQSVWVEVTPKAQILFIEDRGYKTFVDHGLADLRARNIPVTWALDPLLNSSNPGTIFEAISDAQVAQFYAEGDDMSIHAYDGAVTADMTPDQIREDTLKSHQWLQERGYTRGGVWRAAWTQNLATNHAAAQPYYAAYATHQGVSSMETWPFSNKWNVKRIALHSATNSQMDAHFATLQRTNSLMVCYTHGIADATGGAISHADWDYFISKIDEGIAGGWLEGVTFSQLLERSGGVIR